MGELDRLRRSALIGEDPYSELANPWRSEGEDDFGKRMAAQMLSNGEAFGEGDPEGVYKAMQGNDAFGMAETYSAAEQMLKPDPEGKNFLQRFVGAVMPVFETLGAPQQVMYQLATGGDWREAVPSWIAPDSWEAEGVSHEMLSFGDVMNVWSDGALDDWYQQDGILNQTGEVLLKTAFFGGDVFTDPLSYVSGAAAVKLARKTLPLGLQTKYSTKLALRAQNAANIDDAISVNERYITKLQDEIKVKPSKRASGHLANAEKNRAMLAELKRDTTIMAEDLADDTITDFASAPFVQKTSPRSWSKGATDGADLAPPKVVQGELFSMPDTVESLQKEYAEAYELKQFKLITPSAEDSPLLRLTREEVNKIPYWSELDSTIQKDPQKWSLFNNITEWHVRKEVGSTDLNEIADFYIDKYGLDKMPKLREEKGVPLPEFKGVEVVDMENYGEFHSYNWNGRTYPDKILLKSGESHSQQVTTLMHELQHWVEMASPKGKQFKVTAKRPQDYVRPGKYVFRPDGKFDYDVVGIEGHFRDYGAFNSEIAQELDIKAALMEGIHVPQEVLDGYPELAKMAKKIKKAGDGQQSLFPRTTDKMLKNAEEHAARLTDAVENGGFKGEALDTVKGELDRATTKLEKAKIDHSNWSDLKKAHRAERERLRHIQDLGDDVADHNRQMIQGDSEQISIAAGDLVLGVNANSINLRTPKARDYFDGMSVSPLGVSKRGMVNARKADVPEVIRSLESRIAAAKGDSLSALTPGTGVGKAGKAAAKKEIKRLEKLLADVKEHGIRDKDLGRLEGVLPNSNRRSPLLEENYLKGKWGAAAEKVAGVTLYPKAYMIQSPGWFSHLFREPSRALQGAAPEMRDRLVGGMKGYQAFQNNIRLETQSIFRNAGIYEEAGFKSKAASMFAHNNVPPINKEKSEQLFHLLDEGADTSVEGIEAYAKLVSEASPEMLKARDDMRALLDAMAEKVGVGKPGGPKRREGYAPHMRDMDHFFMDKKWFKDGKLPPDFEGSNGGKIYFGNLMPRLGEGKDITSMVEVMDSYTRGVARKAYLEPMTTDLYYLARKRSGKDSKQKWLMDFTNDLTKNLQGAPSALGQQMDRLARFSGRPNLAKRAGSGFATLTYSAALVGNIRYPVMSILQTLNTTSAKYGPLEALRGVAKFATAEGRATAKAAGIDAEVLQIYDNMSGLATRLKVPGTPAIEQTEFFIRGITFFAEAGQIARRHGYDSLEALQKADDVLYRNVVANASRSTEEINHIFGQIGRPVKASRISKTGAGLATQFFSFPFKQSETLLDIGMQNPGHFVDYLYTAGKMQSLIAREMDLDISEYVGVQYAEDMVDIVKGEKLALPLQTMGALAQVPANLLKVMDGADPGELNRNFSAIMKQIEMLVPAKTGIEQRFEGGADLLRMAKGETLEMRKERRGNIESLARAAAGKGSFGENKYGELKYKRDQSELATVFTGLRSMQGKIEAEVAEGKWKRNQQVRSMQESLTQAIWDGVRTGSMDKNTLQQHIKELNKLGLNYKDISQLKDRTAKAMYAAHMTTKVRESELETGGTAAFSKALRDRAEKENH